MFKQWLTDRNETCRQQVDVVAMDGFTGFKTGRFIDPEGDPAILDDYRA